MAHSPSSLSRNHQLDPATACGVPQKPQCTNFRVYNWDVKCTGLKVGGLAFTV